MQCCLELISSIAGNSSVKVSLVLCTSYTLHTTCTILSSVVVHTVYRTVHQFADDSTGDSVRVNHFGTRDFDPLERLILVSNDPLKQSLLNDEKVLNCLIPLITVSSVSRSEVTSAAHRRTEVQADNNKSRYGKWPSGEQPSLIWNKYWCLTYYSNRSHRSNEVVADLSLLLF